MEFSPLEPDEEYEEGEEWIFSYADLMSLMVGFFVILFLFSGPESQKNKDLAEDIAGSFQGQREETATIKDSEKRSQMLSRMLLLLGVKEGEEDQALQKIQAIYDERERIQDVASFLQRQWSGFDDLAYSFSQKGKAFKIVLPTHLLFQDGSTLDVSPQSRQQLSDLGRKIAHLPQFGPIAIEAHAAEKNGDSYALEKTAIQASRIAQILVEAGVKPERLRVSGMGQMHPLDPGILKAKKSSASVFAQGRIEIWVY